MLKLLFKILQSFPAFQKLLSEYFAAENAKLEKQVADYKLKSLDDAATIDRLRGDAEAYKCESARLEAESARRLDTIYARDAEIARLKLETEKKLAGVDAMDSEAVFDASLGRPAPRAITTGFAVYDKNR